MKADVQQIGIVLLLIGLSLLSGCSINPIELAEDISRESFAVITEAGDFLFELMSSEDLFIKDLTVNVENKELVIKGRIKRGPQNCCDNVTGHIDIAAFTSDGFLIDSFSVLFSPRAIPKGGTKSSRFEARISEELPANSVIKVAYHNTVKFVDSDAKETRRDCGENIALLGDIMQEIKTVELGD